VTSDPPISETGGLRSSLTVGTSIAAWSVGAVAYFLIAGRALGPDAYGLVAALQAVVVVVALPITGAQWSIARVVAASANEQRADAQAVYRRALTGGTLLATALALVATAVTLIVRATDEAVPTWPLIITFLTVVAITPLTLACGALQGEQRYTGFAWSYGSTGVLRAPLLLILLLLPMGATDASMLAVAIAVAIGSLWAIWLTRTDLRVATRPSPDLWRNFLRALPAAAVGLAGIAALANVDVVVAKLSLGGEDAGLFGAASLVAKSLLLVPQALIIVLLPRVAARESRGGHTGSLLAVGVLTMFAAGILAMVVSVPLADPIMTIAFGSQFTAAGSLLVPFFGATTLLGALLILINHHVARSDHRFVWCVGGLAILQIVLLALFSTSSEAIIAIDAIVGGIGLVIHEMIYFTTDQSILRGAGAQFAAIMRRVTRRDGGST
jgi:hypothetical protein